jgi:hypothetical protein
VSDRLAAILGLPVGVTLAVFSTLCIAKPDKIADYARRRYLGSKVLQKWAFSNIVMKAWYPRYLRIWGLFGLTVGLGWIVISLFMGFLVLSK